MYIKTKQTKCLPTEDDSINGGASKCHENCQIVTLHFRLGHLNHAIAPLNGFYHPDINLVFFVCFVYFLSLCFFYRVVFVFRHFSHANQITK